MTGDELRAVKLADEKSRASAPPPPKPSELDVVPGLRVNQAQVAQAKAFASKRGVTVAEGLLALGHVKEDDIIAREAELTSGLWLSREQLDAIEGLNGLPPELCTGLQVLPVALTAKQITVAMRDPLDRGLLQTIAEHAGGIRVVGVRAGATALQLTIARVSAAIDENDPESWIER